MKFVIFGMLLFTSIAHAAVDKPAWSDRTRGEKPNRESVAERGAPSTASSYDFGYCAASIINTSPLTAQRMYDEVKARGELALEEFRGGFRAYVELTQRDPVTGWTRASRSCTGYNLMPITFKKKESSNEVK